MLCGVNLAYTPGGSGSPPLQNIGLITSMTGLGADRKAVENIHNSLVNLWGQRLFSCIAMMRTFSVGIVFDSNDVVWITNLQALPGVITITWPAETSYTTGGAITFTGAITSFSFGAADIEGRVEGSLTISPSGKPTVTAGTHP